jgi:WhiB family redox-sensing transcriptional regulator
VAAVALQSSSPAGPSPDLGARTLPVAGAPASSGAAGLSGPPALPGQGVGSGPGTAGEDLAAAVGARPAWQAVGACRGIDPAVFFPDEGDASSAASAKAICATCPVRTECLEAALVRREKFGVWGGASEAERRRMIRQRRALRRAA